MGRSKRTRQLKNMTDDALRSELHVHLKRALWTLRELDALLSSQGSTWAATGVIAREAAGHLGRIVAICRTGAARKWVALEKAVSS